MPQHLNDIELFEQQRALDYNQFVERWIPGYHYFLNILPKLFHQAEGDNLLVAGCGTGNEINAFVKDAKHWRITGVDPSPYMIAQAQERFLKDADITLVSGTVADLDATICFNAATLLLVLHFLKDDGHKLQLLKDIAQRLNRHAPFVLLDVTGDVTEIKQNLPILQSLLPDGIPVEEIQMRMNRIENELHLVAATRLIALLQEAGFEKPVQFYQTSIYKGWITRKL